MNRSTPLWALSLSLLLSAASLSSFAQDITPTPRQTFTAFATDTPLSELKFKPLNMADAPHSQPDAQNTPPLATIALSEDIVPSTVNPNEEALPGAKTLPGTKTESAPVAASLPLETPLPQPPEKPQLLPFYASASDYLAARGTDEQTHLELIYNVTVGKTKNSLAPASKTRVVTIGPDFAADAFEGKTRIFDFKTNRLLTLRDEDGDIIFDNISLYAGALKNVNTVTRATQKGTLDEIDIGPDVTLNAFWLEASLGWAARRKFDDLKVTRKDNDVSATFGDKSPLSASLIGPKMPTEDHMRTLFAWWHHDLPIHPAILPQMGRPDNAPKSMTILSLSPKFPDGLTSQWELKDSKTYSAPFPLPLSAKTSIEAGKSSPLAFAISQAASGKALKTRPSLDDLRQEILEKREAGNLFEAWLTAQMLSDRLGGCVNDPALLCQDISDIETSAKPGSDLAKLPAIINKANDAKTRREGFIELAPYVEGEIAPAFLVKIAGQARARIRSKNLDDPKLKVLRADKLLEEALVKNPYDPVVYRTLGQVYAAQGRFVESWDMQDAMRRLPDVSEALTEPINRAERSLLLRAPGFFLQELP